MHSALGTRIRMVPAAVTFITRYGSAMSAAPTFLTSAA
jgi:hypothetical protein